MITKNKKLQVAILVLLLIAFEASLAQEKTTGNVLLAEWRFEKVQHLNGDTSPATIDQPLNATNRKPAEPQPFVYDGSGHKNMLQSNGNASIVFSGNVPTEAVDGKPNTRSLSLKKGEILVPFNRVLPFENMQKSWNIEASLMSNWLWVEQVYLCKEGQKGQIAGDVSIGFDNILQQYFVEVTCADGVARRIAAGDPVRAGKWYDVRANAMYDVAKNQTILQIAVKSSEQKDFTKSSSISFPGSALPREAGMWVIGRGYPGGYPNRLEVIDGGIDEVRISGEALPRVAGQNPLFTDAFTADPTALVDGNTVYVYAGEDRAKPGGWFSMPGWRCYSTTDMKHWKEHGTVLQAKDFQYANVGSAWASQVVKKNGKYYFYVTLDNKKGHFITVAVGDSPTGPFKEAAPGKPLITDDMTKDSHRSNSDIDPTVFIDDDGTPWMAWGNGDCYMAKLNKNMVELDGPIIHVPMRNYAEGPWLFKRGNLYYNVYAADAPGVQCEQICYATAPSVTGPWSYRGYVTGAAKHGFTIHPAVIQFEGQWYFFYHDGSNTLNGAPGGDTRRMVSAEYLYFNPDGTIRPITITQAGVSIPPQK